MSREPAQVDEEVIAHTLKRDGMRVGTRELIASLAACAVFAVAEVAFFAWRWPHHVDGLTVALCTAVLVLAARVRIDVALGFTVPTQLAFVPLLFAAPLALVPVLVCFALTIGGAIDVARGKLNIGRLLISAPGNSAFALGPVAVFAAAGSSPSHSGPGLLLGALAAQFAVDFAVSGLREVMEGEASLAAHLSDTWVYLVDAGFSWIGLVVARDLHDSPTVVLSLVPMLALLGVFAGERRARLESMLELGHAYRGTALVLGDVVEADDGYTGEHCRSVVALVLLVGTELGLDRGRRRNLEFGALLHDVGKIAIPKDIINKPDKLDANEWTVIKTHTLEGQKMLDRVGGFMREVGLIVRSHHERWDGGGYPDGLKGYEIPLEARIIACCDAWNAMRTDRVYRKALAYDAAMAELLACTGTQFDPRVVRALVKVIERDERPAQPRLAPAEAEADAADAPSPTVAV